MASYALPATPSQGGVFGESRRRSENLFANAAVESLAKLIQRLKPADRLPPQLGRIQVWNHRGHDETEG
jgi:hypothetical protein